MGTKAGQLHPDRYSGVRCGNISSASVKRHSTGPHSQSNPDAEPLMMNSASPQVLPVLLPLVGMVVAIGCRSTESAYVAPPPAEVTVSEPVRLSFTPFREPS